MSDVLDGFVGILELEIILCDAEDGDEGTAGDFLAVGAVADAGEEWCTCDGVADGAAEAATSHCLRSCIARCCHDDCLKKDEMEVLGRYFRLKSCWTSRNYKSSPMAIQMAGYVRPPTRTIISRHLSYIDLAAASCAIATLRRLQCCGVQ